MTRLRSFARFWYDFVVGDDWRIALGVVLALGLTAGLAHRDLDAWWIPPGTVAVLLALSLRRAVRAAARPRNEDAGPVP
jgi:hypothetical protein